MILDLTLTTPDHGGQPLEPTQLRLWRQNFIIKFTSEYIDKFIKIVTVHSIV